MSSRVVVAVGAAPQFWRRVVGDLSISSQRALQPSVPLWLRQAATVPLLQILRKLQLFPERTSALDRLGLMPFSLPDFVRDPKQVVEMRCTGKQTAIVVGEDNIAGFDQEVTEAS